MNPSLFVGSATESLDIAYTVQEHFEHIAEVTVWTQGIFKLSTSSLDSLLMALDRFDFGIFVFAPNDLIKIRNEEYPSIRDNVIFELGLFIGRLGKDRSFIIAPSQPKDFHLPTDLIGITPAIFTSDRMDKNLNAALGPACHKISRRIKELKLRKPSKHITTTPELRPRMDFTDFLRKGLGNESVSEITMITYTAEVDIGLLQKYFISGPKTITIYKRSILADLAEQQEWNLQNLAKGSNLTKWNKKNKSIEASRRISDYLTPEKANVHQLLYPSPPSKRVYMLDNKDAMIAYYEVSDSSQNKGGSVYKGITKNPAMIIKDSDPLGEFLLEEITQHISSLRRVCRTWEEEKAILFEGTAWSGYGKRPCINPKAIFFDMDGLLLNSLPHYVKAWKSAFDEVGVEFSEERAYMEEGRSGKDTIRKRLQEVGFNDISDAIIENIHSKRREIFKELGPPPIQMGAKELVNSVAESKLDIYVVTGSSDENLGDRLEKEFPGQIFKDKIITGRQTWAGKPNPAPYLFACSKAGVHPHESIAIENAPLGAKSANDAGLFCLCVNTGILPDSSLLKAGAKVIFKDCKDLAEKWSEVMSILRE